MHHSKNTFQKLSVLVCIIGCILIGFPESVQADSIKVLAKRLRTSSSEKSRIAATISLGRLKNKRAVQPLLRALRDKSPIVRSLAAAALGAIGETRALPALRRASKDKVSKVRKRAKTAIKLIRRKNASRSKVVNAMSKNRPKRRAHYRIQGKEAPLAAPQLYVRIRSASYASQKRISKEKRMARRKYLQTLVFAELKSAKKMTTNGNVAKQLRLPEYSVDVSVTRMQKTSNRQWVEILCELRIAISDKQGKMLSFLSGGAKSQVPRRAFRKQYEANMRKEALESAVRNVHANLVKHLLKTTGV